VEGGGKKRSGEKGEKARPLEYFVLVNRREIPNANSPHQAEPLFQQGKKRGRIPPIRTAKEGNEGSF